MTVPMNPYSRPVLTCSFCGKSQNEARQLIAGPAVYICDECVGLAAEIVAEQTMSHDARVEHDVLLAALPYVERFDEQRPASMSCQARSDRAASLIQERLCALRTAGNAPPAVVPFPVKKG